MTSRPEDPRVLPRPASNPRGAATTFDFEGRLVRAHEGESVAVALWAAGIETLARSPKYHRPRGVFCLRGQCGGCFMRIGGRPNVRACTVAVTKDLRCERQNAFPGGDADLFEAADLFFPEGMDHHTMLTSSPLLNRLFMKVVRQVAGAGLLPDSSLTTGALALPAVRDEVCDVLVLGGGPAGLAAAAACAERRKGARIIVLDEQLTLGGSLASEPDGAARAVTLVERARSLGVGLRPRTVWFGAYPEDALGEPPRPPDDAVPAVMGLADADGLIRLVARRVVFATGAYDQNIAFENNDRPGILSARAVGRLVFQEGLHPGRVAVLSDETAGGTSYGETLATGLAERGLAPERLHLRGTKLDFVDHDVLAVDSLPAPATEPLRLCGLAVRFSIEQGGFVLAEEGSSHVDGRTVDRRLFVAGDVTGWRGTLAAEEHGRRVGETVAGSL